MSNTQLIIVGINQLRHHFGPSVNLQSVIYASTETVVGYGYDANDTNLYRLDSDEHIELLDTEKECAIENLCQPVSRAGVSRTR